MLSYSAFSAQNTITAENLATIESVSQVQVSPNGESFAFIRSVPRELYVEKDGKNWGELYLVDDKGVERPFITGKVNIGNITWSADGQLIFFFSKNER